MNSIEEQSELKVGIYFIVKAIIFTDKEFLKEQKFSYVFRTAVSWNNGGSIPLSDSTKN